MDYDDFLADVSEDIDKVKDRFEGIETEESTDYEFDEWVLPEEEEDTKEPKLVGPASPPTKASPEKRSAPGKPVKAETPPKKKKAPASPESASETPGKQSNGPPSPSVKKKPKPVSKKPLKKRPLPPAGKSKPTAQKPPKPPVKDQLKKAPLPPIEELDASDEDVIAKHLVEDPEKIYEDAIAHHLGDEIHSGPSRRFSTKFLLGSVITLGLVLAAAFLSIKDPFGFFKPDSISTSVAQKTATAPATAHKVPSPPSPTHDQTPAGGEIRQTTPETPTTSGVQEPQPAPKPTMDVPQQPKAASEPGPPASETETAVGSTPPQLAMAEPAGRQPPGQTEAASQPSSDTPVVMVQPTRVTAETPPAATQNISTQLPTAAAPKPVSADTQVKAFLDMWAAAWEATAGPNGDFSAYEACYSDYFMARGMDKAAFIQDKKVKNRRKKWITIGVQDINVKEQGASNRIKASFTQVYSSSNYSSSSPKTLVLSKEPDGLKIIGVSP